MKIVCNEKEWTVTEGESAFGLRERVLPSAEVVILNGFQLSADQSLAEGDRVSLIRKGTLPPPEELEHLLVARHTPGVHGRLKGATVGIAGLGGLGSNIAAALCRLGVGKLVIADFDVVDPSNLNRQNYLVKHLGRKKTEATKELLSEMNPFVEVRAHDAFLTGENVAELFREVDVFVEALDNPASKAELVGSLLAQCPELPIVAASGMAGYDSGNGIRTSRRMKNLYVCGDGETGAAPGNGLMAPRVMITAGAQANMVLRLLLGEREP